MGLPRIPLFAVIILSTAFPVLAQTRGQEFFIYCDRGMLSLSAENIDLNEVLAAVADQAGISVTSPKNLEKLVTAKFSNVPLDQGLRRILKGLSYALMYAPADEKNGAESVSGVYVCPKGSRRRRISRRTSGPHVKLRTEEERRVAALERYERRLDFLERQMAQVGADSPRGQAIDRQIRLLEQRIEKLHEQ